MPTTWGWEWREIMYVKCLTCDSYSINGNYYDCNLKRRSLPLTTHHHHIYQIVYPQWEGSWRHGHKVNLHWWNTKFGARDVTKEGSVKGVPPPNKSQSTDIWFTNKSLTSLVSTGQPCRVRPLLSKLTKLRSWPAMPRWGAAAVCLLHDGRTLDRALPPCVIFDTRDGGPHFRAVHTVVLFRCSVLSDSLQPHGL